MAKAFTWSFSRLKNYETCPRRHHEVDILKHWQEPPEPGGALDWGNQVHAALANSCLTGTLLPPEMADYQGWVNRVRAGVGDLYVEQKYAITKDFQKTSFFANNVWCRSVSDVTRVNGNAAITLDWKTGKVDRVPSVQLMLVAQNIFSFYPQVQYVHAEYIWLKDDTNTPRGFTRQDVANEWVTLLPRVQAMEAAHVMNSYPPKPNNYCKSYCPVKTCEFYKKGR